MADKSLPPTVKELADMPENEFLELCRDVDRVESQSAFKEAGIDALGALANGALSVGFMLSGALLGAVPNAVLAGVSVWRGIQALGEGIRKASQSSSADTVLQVLYPPEPPPGTVIKEAAPAGRMATAITPGIRM